MFLTLFLALQYTTCCCLILAHQMYMYYNVYLMSVNQVVLFLTACLPYLHPFVYNVFYERRNENNFLYIFQCTYSSTEKITTEIILGINLQCT